MWAWRGQSRLLVLSSVPSATVPEFGALECGQIFACRMRIQGTMQSEVEINGAHQVREGSLDIVQQHQQRSVGALSWPTLSSLAYS